MTSIGATPAYRGYRLQALYSLHRLLESQAHGMATFQPEGAEDLAVFGATSELQEVIQVKALSHDLILSDFNPQKPDTFFYRIKQHLISAPQAQVRIVSFGPIGPELDAALSGDANVRKRIAARLSNYGRMSEAEADELLARIELVTVREAALLESVDAAIRQSHNGIDPAAALSLMTAWLYDCAEYQLPINRQDMLAKVEAIGQFLADCATHQREWFTSIVPISATSISDERARELDEEYYQGIAARYEHIVVGLDVLRSAKLERLTQAFNESHVVVLHGASGQGKSTLAYRYLHEYFPDHCRYQVLRVESVTHALSVATALLGHVEAIGVSLGIYLDVTPSDTGWDELVRRLGHHERIRLLVTMREEDWRRATISPTDVRIAEVPLWFDETEARALYEELAAHRQPAHVLTFEDAWAVFGSQGPLLEFVYVVTQGTALRERLGQQVQRLQDEVRLGKITESELTLLRLVSVAGATGARMYAARLAAYLGLSAPARTLTLFENEYMLRLSLDGTSVGPLHPVRSSILAELLSDPVFSPIGGSAADCLPLLLDEDVEQFLLGVFVYQREAAATVAERASSWHPNLWVAIGGVARALLWLGLAEYVEANRVLLSEVYGEVGDGAIWALDFDVAGILPGGIAAFRGAIAPLASSERKQRIAEFQSRQTPPSHVFDRLSAYLVDRTQSPLPPETEGDWAAVAEVVFWLGHLHITWPLSRWLPESQLDNIVTSLSLEALADVVLGLFTGYNFGFTPWLLSHRERMVARFRSETLTFAMEDDGNKVSAYYIVEADPVQLPQQGSNKLRTQDSRNPLHNTALQHISLLRRLFPDREVFACQGFGHRLVDWELPSDDTRKTGISRSSLHPRWQAALNATFRGLVHWQFRPTTWDEYTQAMQRLRQAVLASLSELERGLDIYFRRQNQVRILGELVDETAWNDCRRLLRTVPSLPRAAVDPWGVTAEDSVNPPRQDQGDQPGEQRRKALALQQYLPLLTTVKAFTFSLRNFFDYAVHVLSVNPLLGRQARDAATRQTLLERAEQLGLKPHDAPRLSAFNCVNAFQSLETFQREFRHRCAPLVSSDVLVNLEREERHVLAAVWERWYMFAYFPGRRVQQASPYCHDYLTALREKAKRRLARELRVLSTTSPSQQKIEARILSEQVSWDDKPTLWITLDGDLPVNAYASLDPAIEAISRALAAEPDKDLQPYLLTVWWSQVAIVPLTRGKNLSSSAWRIPTGAFLNAERLGGINAWNRVPQDVPPTSLDKLGISNWELPQMQEALTLASTVSALSLLTAHLRDLAQGPELDEQGTSDAQQYVRRIEPQLRAVLQSAIDAETTLLTTLSSSSIPLDAANTYRSEATSMLVALYEMTLPFRDFQGQQELTIQAIAEWAGRLEKAREQSFLIYLALASAAIEEQMNSETNSNAAVSHREKFTKKKKQMHKRPRR